MLGALKNAVRETAKTAVFVAAGNGPWLRRRLDRLRDSGVSVILNLHRVAPNDRSSYRPLAPAIFEELIRFAKREFAVVTIGELEANTARPKLVLSFDDGYRDFALYADPILRKHGVRANHNVIPRCIETGLPPLNVTAQDFVGKAPAELVERIEIDGFSAPFDRSYGHRPYLLQGGVFTQIMISSTSPIKEFKQNSVTLGTVPAPVPEPATWALMLLGFGGMGMALRRSRRRGKPTLMQIA